MTDSQVSKPLAVGVDLIRSTRDMVVFNYWSHGIPISQRSFWLLTADPAQLIDDARRGIRH